MRLKVTFFIALLFTLFIAATKPASAQPAFSCEFYPGLIDGQDCVVNLPPVSDDDYICDYSVGSPEQLYCGAFSEDENACDSATGWCQECSSPGVCQQGGCQSGYTPLADKCASPSATCCIPEDQEPPPATECYRCVHNLSKFVCQLYLLEPPGSCDPDWELRSTCETECENTSSFESFSCDPCNSGLNCTPAASGEFTGANAYDDCEKACADRECFDSPILCKGKGINSAIGCIPVGSSQEMVGFLLTWGIGIAGGISLLLIAYSGFLITTSQGDPQRLQAGKELLTAALSGLILIVFSVTFLRIIGVDILGIPGFK